MDKQDLYKIEINNLKKEIQELQDTLIKINMNQKKDAS